MLRRVVSWVTPLVSAIIGFRLLRDAAYNYQYWRNTVNDPSAKDAYLTFLEGDMLLLALLGLATAVVLWMLARWRRANPGA